MGLLLALGLSAGAGVGCEGDLAFERGFGDFCSGPAACAAGLYCNLAEQRCEPLDELGAPCTTPAQCASGICIQSVCCDGPCNRSCLSCAVGDKPGSCSNVLPDQDPHDHCPGSAACNELGNCEGGPVEATSYGDAADDEGVRVVADPDGRTVYIAGAFRGALELAGGTPSLGQRDIFVSAIRYQDNPSLNPVALWTVTFGSAGDDRAHDLALAHDGRLVVVGDFEGNLDVLGTPLVAEGRDGFVVELSSGGTTATIVEQLGGAGDQSARAVLFTPDGGIVVAGDFDGELIAGNGATPPAGGRDVLLARFDPNGDVAWQRIVGDADDQVATALAYSETSDELLVAISGRGTVDTGGAQIAGSSDDDDLFLARFAASNGSGGNVLLFGGQGVQRANAIGVDPERDEMGALVSEAIWLVGTFTRELLVPAGPTFVAADQRDGFCTLLTQNGVHVDSQALSGPFDDEPLDLTIDAQHNAIVVGRFGLEMTIGESGSTLESVGGTDLFLLKLDPDGRENWAQAYGGLLDDRAASVTTAGGDPIVFGDFEASLAFGPLTVNASGGTDLFLARFRP